MASNFNKALDKIRAKSSNTVEQGTLLKSYLKFILKMMTSRNRNLIKYGTTKIGQEKILAFHRLI